MSVFVRDSTVLIEITDVSSQQTRSSFKAIAPKNQRQAASCVPSWDEPLSSWSSSGLKRTFDFLCVFCALPILIPVYLAIGLAVRLTSKGPVLFLQKRIGLYGRPFTVLKFRTMVHQHGAEHQRVTTSGDQRFTRVGAFLRRWKLDELPQLLNVLAGQMSLVGPRPKLPEHEPLSLPCRPGVTGAATVAFALEEFELERVPRHQLDDFYNNIVLPAKRNLDKHYMAQATFRSDLGLIVDSLLRRWDPSTLKKLLAHESRAVPNWRLQPLQPLEVQDLHFKVPLGLRFEEPVTAEKDIGS